MVIRGQKPTSQRDNFILEYLEGSKLTTSLVRKFINESDLRVARYPVYRARAVKRPVEVGTEKEVKFPRQMVSASLRPNNAARAAMSYINDTAQSVSYIEVWEIHNAVIVADHIELMEVVKRTSSHEHHIRRTAQELEEFIRGGTYQAKCISVYDAQSIYGRANWPKI